MKLRTLEERKQELVKLLLQENAILKAHPTLYKSTVDNVEHAIAANESIIAKVDDLSEYNLDTYLVITHRIKEDYDREIG